MVRIFPVGEINGGNHPFIAVSLFIACIAATIAIVSSLCGSLLRKKSEPSSDANEMKGNKDGKVSSPDGAQTNDPSTRPPATASESGTTMDIAQPQNEEELGQQLLPPPPGRRHLSGTASCHFRSNSTASTSSQTKLSTSRSMRVFGNTMRQASKREDNDKRKDKKLKHEDSVWKKTIILGEKCKVPEEEDDTILYDEKGNRISTYHRKTAKPLSTHSSNIDPDSIPR